MNGRQQPTVLCVGAADMDLLLSMRAMPAPGTEAVEDNRFDYAAGGGAAEAALTIARLGGRAALCARVGADIHGRRLLHLYEDSGVDVRGVTPDRRAPTGFRTILREDSGARRALVYPGANLNLSTADAERAAADIRPDAAYLQVDGVPDAAIGASRLFAADGLPVFLDACRATESALLSSFARAEVFLTDADCAYRLTGTRPAGSDSCLKASMALEKTARARYYVTYIGDRGFHIYDGRYCHMVSGYGRMTASEPPEGGLCAALILRYLEGGDILAACRFALGFAELMKSNRADPGYFPTAADIDAYIDRN